jgi:hypothetical protein
MEPWSSGDGKRALFRNFRRLNPEYTQAIADELKHLDHETLILWGREDPFPEARVCREDPKRDSECRAHLDR